mmetsp:Transcript_38730/g.81439  ORF Transcript_38730/g.81439 Transcript_38730/m.81439 type:complete len:247 (+) Transcript_38730:1366-2106(+)
MASFGRGLRWDEIFCRVTDSTDEELRRIASEVYGGAGMDDSIVNSSGSELPSGEVQKDQSPQSTSEDWKVSLSKPVEKVVLQLNGGNDSPVQFELIPMYNKCTITDTPLGPFRRIKMSISQTSGEGEAVFPHAKANAHVHFQKDPSSSSSSGNDSAHEVIKLFIDSLALATVEHSTCQTSYDEVGITLLEENFPSKEWRQLGDLEGKSVVVQLGFKRLSRGTVPAGSTLLRGYAFSQAFLSQPIVD